MELSALRAYGVRADSFDCDKREWCKHPPNYWL